MTRHTLMALTMGALMGLMMLWMLHGAVTGETQRSLAGAAVFVGAHVLVLAVLLALPAFAARRAPWLHARLSRLHRPSLRHVSLMLGAAGTSALIVHLIHGAPV